MPDDDALDALDAGPLAPEAPRSALLAHVGLFLVGLTLGLFGVGLAPARLVLRGMTIPFGLVLIVLALGVIARAGAWLVGTRKGAAFVALGWVLPTLAFVLAGPGGDVLLPDLARTWWYLLGGAGLLVLAMAWPLPTGAEQLAAARRSGLPDPADVPEPGAVTAPSADDPVA